MALNATIMGDAMDDALDALMIAAGKPGLPSEPAVRWRTASGCFTPLRPG